MEKDLPLNVNQVEKITGFPINFLLFSEIVKFDDIDDIFINDVCLINYLENPKMGHYCCLTRNRNSNKIIYYNPTGLFIDEHIEYLPEFKFISNQYYPHLLELLSKCNYEVHYMHYPLQKYDTNSCGRFCALFMKFKYFDEEDMIKLLKDKTNDEIIRITNEYFFY